ncbi:MAG: ABC transporter substrate-binding protein [Deltaproteobacteria bacterium]|nr:ABC transporter substrate-binding protein [Deltaproteobacteria bacterium]MBI3077591.1 ABC transporter substrate-binding protein [Deltaproteobacteria bacterium]
MKGKDGHRVASWAAILAGIAIVLLLQAAPGRAQEKVTFALDFFAYGKHAGFYAALDRGFYREQGLDVTILRGSGSGDTIKRIGAGSENFGFADTASLIPARARGVQVKEIAMIHDRNLHTLFFLKGSGMTRPKDLEGRRIGGTEGDATRVIFPAFAAVNGIDEKKVEWVTMTAEARLPSLLAGRVDAGVWFFTEAPTVLARARQVGKEVGWFLYPDWGVDVYSNGLIATDRTIRERPDLTRRFVHATLKGVAWGVENPEAVVDLFVRHQPTISRDLAMAHWQIAVDHLMTATAVKMGIGYMTREKMERTRDLITETMKLPVKVPVEDLYTNEFLPKLFPRRK